ncbi:hypothetical protein JZU71_04245, partial [bacterium]|nr:hypothetical protein [bacterium]
PYLLTGLPKKYLIVCKIIITLFNWKMLDYSSIFFCKSFIHSAEFFPVTAPADRESALAKAE